MSRWNAKHHVMLHGAEIPLQIMNEDIFDITRSLVRRKWNINLSPGDLAQCHRLGDGIILLFKDFKPNSVFAQILDPNKRDRDQRYYTNLLY